MNGSVETDRTTAGIGRRVVARLIDWIVMWVFSGVVLVPVFIIIVFSGLVGSPYGDSTGVASALLIVFVAVFLAYVSLMESRKAQTLGKMAMKIHVTGPDGGHPTMRSTFLRNVWIATFALPTIGPFVFLAVASAIGVSIAVSSSGVGLHDRSGGGTRVVDDVY